MRLAASPRRRRVLAAITTTALLAGGLQLFTAAPATAAVRVSSYPVGNGLNELPIFVSPEEVSATFDGPVSALSFVSLSTQGLPRVEQPLCRATSRVAGNVISCVPGPLQDGLYQASFMFDDPLQPPLNLTSVLFRVSTAAAVTAPETATVAMASALPITGAFPYAETVTVTVSNVVGQRTAPVAFNPANLAAGTFSGVVDVASLGRGTLTVEARATEARNNSTKTAQDTVVVGAEGDGPVLVGGTPQPGSRVRFTTRVAAFYDRPLSPLSMITVTSSAGTAVAGCSMQLDTDGDTALECAPASSLPADTYTVTTTARNATPTGLPPTFATTTDTYAFVVDLTGPRFLDVTVTPDPVTSLTTKVLTVAGRTDEPDGRLQVRVRDTSTTTPDRVVNAQSDAGGGFSVPVDVAALAEGPLTVEVVAFDEAGNSSTFQDSVLKDTRAPVLTSSTPADGSTVRPPSVVTLVFDEALSAASSTVVLLDESGDTVETTSSVDGRTLSATPTVPLVDGPYRAVATSTDAVGNPSTATVAFTVDGTPPPPPTLTLPAAVANVATARGTGEPGATATVVLTDAQGDAATGTVRIGADGTYEVAIDVSYLAQGPLTGRATAVDAAGNRSLPSAPATTRRDSVAPAVTVAPVVPDPLNAQTARTVDVTGTVGEDDARLVLVVADRLGRTVSATPTAVTGGRYSFDDVDVTSLADGTLTFTVQASDALGNTATASETAVLDATAPAVTGLAVDPSRISAATDSAVEVTGATEPGSVVDVVVTDANGSPVSATATAGTDGAFRVVLDLTGLADGELTVTAQATDRAGNQGDVARAGAVKDATQPPAPTVEAAPASLANAATYTVTGLTEAGATVTVVISDGTDSATRTVTAGPDGGYTATFDVRSLDDGTLTLTATAVDGFDNASPTTRTTRDKDTVAPAAPADVRIVDDPVRGPADGPATATVTGRTTDGDGATVQVVFTDGTRSTAPVTVTPAADGTFSAAVDIAALADGPVTVRVVAVDRVGNRSAAATDTAVKDTVALELVSSDPTDGSRVPPRSTVSATYSEPLDAAASTVVVRNVRGNTVAGSVALSADGRTLTFTRTSGQFDTTGDPYTATSSVGDRSGERRVDEVTFGIIDAPTVQLTDPITSANVDRVVASGATEPGATVTVTLSGVGADIVLTAVADATGAYATAPTSVRGLGDGTVTATARATATDGAVSGAATDTARKDTIAPILETSDPVDGATVRSADAVTLTYDEAPDTATVAVRGPAGPVAGTTTSETRTVVFRPAAPLADGTYVVTAVARDALGNERTSTVTFTVDSTPPPLTLSASDVGAAEDPFTEFRGTTEPGLTITTTLTSGDRSFTGLSFAREDGTFNGFVDLSDFPQGRFTVTSVVEDAAGNRRTATTTAVKDTVAPAVTGLSATPVTAATPTTTITGSTEPGATVTVTVRDSAGGTVSGPASVDRDGRFTATLDASSLAAGTLTVTATATDAFGNAGSATTTTRTDPVAPSPSPSTGSPSPESPSPSPTTASPTPSTSPSATGSATPVPSGSASPSVSPSASPSVSPSTSPSASPSVSPSPVLPVQTGDGYVALTSPVRVLDSRTAVGTTRGLKRGAVVLDLSSRVPAGATAAVLNVTVTNPSANGFVVVYPSGNAKPGTSNVNFLRGQTQANEVVVGLPADKRVVVFVDSAQANVIADLVGSFDPSATGQLVTQVPERVLDSRVPIGTTRGVKRGEVVLDLSDRLPAGATSVALNVTVTGPSARGFVVVYPTGTTRPGTSNVNFERGQTQANEVVTRVGAGGRVSILVDSATAHVIADLVAVVVPRGGQLFTPLAQPQRVLDSRPGSGNVGTPAGRKAGNVVLTLPAGVVPAGATGVVLNVTTTGASRTGFVSVFPTGTANPGTSNVNFRPGANQANEVLTAVDGQGRLTLFVGGSGGPVTHLVADVVGYLTPGS